MISVSSQKEKERTTMYRSSHPSKRPYDSGSSGRSQYPSHPFHNSKQPTEVQVLTNQFKLLPFRSNAESDADVNVANYCQYDVIIKNGFYMKSKDEVTGEETRVFHTKEICQKDMHDFVKTRMPWRIMKKFVEEYKVEVAYDGNKKAYSPSATLGPKVGREYKVSVKRDCEEDDPDASKVGEKVFALTFHETNTIPCKEVMELLKGGESSIREEIITMFTVCLKSAAILTRGMISLEADSSSVFFPLSMQRSLLDRKASLESRDGTKILLSGVKTNVVAVKKGLCVQTESVVKYANKEHIQVFQEEERHREGASRVPLLHIRGGGGATIAGVRIDDVHRPIPDYLHDSITAAIKKLGNVNVEYYSRKAGKEGVKLFKNKPFRKSKRVEDVRGHGKKIIWAANDPSLHSFSAKGQEMTVASYFEIEHGIKLKYPHMPIVHVDNFSRFGGGWIPIELVYQAFTKSKENSEEIVTNILKYHDAIAGKKYIKEVEMKLSELSLAGGNHATFRDRLKSWRIEIQSGAVESTAKVLKPPTIQFGNTRASTNNGSFNLNRTQFARPAKLASFVVVNFTRSNRSCYEFIKTVLNVAQTHGIEIPSITMELSKNDRYLDNVSVHYDGKNDIDDALDTIRDGILKAKQFHLYDSQRFYRNKNAFYHTHCYNEKQEEVECLVLPPLCEGGPLGLILEYSTMNKQEHYPSHQIETNSGIKYPVRLMVKISATDTLIDPLDFRYHDGYHQVMRSDGTWVNVKFMEYRYVHKGENPMEFSEADIQSKTFVHSLENWEVDFPSLVFAYMPDDGKALYDRIKTMSNYVGGIQSQCAVARKFEAQRNKEQYASNIATKINAKLSTIHDKAITWKSHSDGSSIGHDYIPWVGDEPTLVIGIGLVHGMDKTVVSASVCLDGGCMRLSLSCFIQAKADTVSDLVMKDITRVSIDHYISENNNCTPKRILLFRDGISDGNFHIAQAEIGSVQQVLEETIGRIPITFVICQSQQQGFKMVPSAETNSRGKPDTNVGSGTLMQCGTSSFYLIAQGGLKGTSKPVKHVIFMNENENPDNGRNGLSIENLMNCTFHMCWKYPTATKAVRELPLIKYAKRLGNQVLSSVRILEAGCHWFGKNIRLVCPRDDSGDDMDKRAYLEWRDEQGTKKRSYNITVMPFRTHLAA